MICVRNPMLRVVFFVISLVVGNLLISHFGRIYVNQFSGYLRGNRRRLISILRIEWLMLHADLLIYIHLFSMFQPPYCIIKFGSNSTGKGLKANGVLKQLRRRWLYVFVVMMCITHMAYPLYLIESFRVYWLLYDICEMLGGVWLILCSFSLFFVTMNLLFDALLWLNVFRRYVFERLVAPYTPLTLFFRIPQFQALLTLLFTVVLCLVHYYSSDKLVVKRQTIHLAPSGSTTINSNSSLRVAVLTDLHIGASVYRSQIADVVEKVNELNADAVFIIGDAIDAPRHLIEDRVEPLQHMHSRLGIFFVTGNHEYYYGNVEEWISLFISYGITTLRNTITHLDGLCVVGLDDISSEWSGIIGHAMNVSAIEACEIGAPVVVLAHNPASVAQIVEFSRNTGHPVHLILSGHTHAAQYMTMVPYIYWFLPYFYGNYNVQSTVGALPQAGNGEETTTVKATQLLVSAGTLYQGAPMKIPFMSEIWLLNIVY